ncbi:MAG: hypothetical protein R2856_35720 [Caldilineaceae bacterium]
MTGHRASTSLRSKATKGKVTVEGDRWRRSVQHRALLHRLHREGWATRRELQEEAEQVRVLLQPGRSRRRG